MHKRSSKPDNVDLFSLNLGGPLYQLYLFTRLAKRPLELCKRRTLVIILLAWAPLLLLTLLGGTAYNNVAVPFIFDIDVHVRLLGVLALLIIAEVITHKHIGIIVQQFLIRNIISLNHRTQFNVITASAMRLRNSAAIEILLILFVYTCGHLISKNVTSFDLSTWYGSKVNDIIQLTPAGYWYSYFSIPLFQFILVRWYFRIFIWYRFLWQVSRLSLKLNSLHPDRSGGLGFLTDSVYAFMPLLLAHTVMLSGMIMGRIINAGATLPEFSTEIIAIIIFLLILPLAPMLFFILSLVNTKRIGTLEYGIVANRYVNDFRHKWINSDSHNNNVAILGTADIQSLSDLGNSFDISNQMRVTPFGQKTIIMLLAVVVIPLIPLILTMIPLEKIIYNAIAIIL